MHTGTIIVSVEAVALFSLIGFAAVITIIVTAVVPRVLQVRRLFRSLTEVSKRDQWTQRRIANIRNGFEDVVKTNKEVDPAQDVVDLFKGI